jgi:hypothetical protein
MIKALAFFPWWSVEHEHRIGSIRLLPYERGLKPGNQPNATQKDIDSVIGAYGELPGKKVNKATLLEVAGWTLGCDPDAVLTELFAVREIVAYSVISNRRLFFGHSRYCCFDNFKLTVQRYVEGKGDMFAYSTRRRDGGVTNLWGSDEFAFHRPLHVNGVDGVGFDEEIVNLLIGSRNPSWLNAISEFNRANTDSSDISPNVEMIMMKSAFEQLLEINQYANSFDIALCRLLPDLPSHSDSEGPLKDRWRMAYPKSLGPMTAWAREFCTRRGRAAHGRASSSREGVWSDDAHLAFCSVLFPLLLKKIAWEKGFYEVNAFDLERLRRINDYLMHDPFIVRDDGGGESHPWVEIELHAHLRQALLSRGRQLSETLDVIVGADKQI